jgi:hypothetical protein
VHLVNPLRERCTSRLPHRALDVVAAFVAVPLWLVTRGVYGPTRGRLAGVPLPYGPYLSYIADLPYREQRTIVFDHLAAPTAFYIRRPEFASWFERAGLREVRIEHHNANSWRGFASVPQAPADSAAGATAPASARRGAAGGAPAPGARERT